MSGLGPWRGGSRGSGGFGTPFSSDVWDPFDLNPSTWSGGGGGGGHIDPRDDTAALAHAHVDWRETDNAHIFRADLPGVKKEEVKVLVEDGNVLQISGERTKEQENTNDKWHRVERRRGSFTRKFRLPENANADDIKCGLENGVLTVTVPKKKSAQETPKNVKYIDVA